METGSGKTWTLFARIDRLKMGRMAGGVGVGKGEAVVTQTTR